jgi:diaminopimelate epimerase
MLSPMRIEFLKMQGLGNDFFVFDAPVAANAHLDSEKLRALADRHTGVGFDQALMLEAPRDAGTRAFYRIFNADGSEVEQCGNGARCIAALLYTRAPELGRELTMGSPGGTVRARIGDDGLVSVDMGVPSFDESASYALKINGSEIEIGAVSIGNLHAVLLVPDVDTAPVEVLGPKIEHHPRFPKRVNAGFMQIVDRGQIRLRVFERGVGETLACGTGAGGAVAVGRRQGLLDARVRVQMRGGTALVSWPGAGEHLWLTGPAITVFTGSIDI